MKELFRQILIDLYKDVPQEVYEGLISVMLLSSVAVFAAYGIKRGWRKVSALLVVEYIFLLYCSTVFFRTYAESREHNFHLFWSYVAIQEGRYELILENVMNVVTFLPSRIIVSVRIPLDDLVESFVNKRGRLCINRSNAILSEKRVCRNG